MNRYFYSGVVAATLAFLAGCPGQEDAVFCPTTGIVCPKDYFCAAAQPVCLTSLCGNGTVDVGEVCDDGNILDGDGCNNACKREECGDNKQDVGELCDDGNTAGGDGCSAACTVESCGNNVTDVGEECDDGNQDNQDGCTGTPIEISDGMGGTMRSPEPCSSTEVCGNGLKDFQVGEVCDDGNTISGDGCNSDCRSGEGCGNGILDPGEECDDGNAMETDACRTADADNDGVGDCKRNVCGDGIVRTGFEQCDDGLSTTNPAPVETGPDGTGYPGCNIDCSLALCDDFKVNATAGEECDNGPGNSNPGNNGNFNTNDCTKTCKINVCGDGLIDDFGTRTEECDDMNSDNTDSCSNGCRSTTCGDGIVQANEQCDDGDGNNEASDDLDACAQCRNARCGDTFIRTGVEDCDEGDVLPGDGCSTSCQFEECHDGTKDPQEECDDNNQDNSDNCVGECLLATCGDGFVRTGIEQCEPPNTVTCSETCQSRGCGNSILDPGEACDDGCLKSAGPGCTPTDNGDGCDQNCRFENCGNGRIDSGEDCDGTGTTTVTGTPGETAACNADCTFTDCGDGKVNVTATEQCDDVDTNGNSLNADDRDCTANCRVNYCGDTLVNEEGPVNSETCDDGNPNNLDGCTNLCTSGSCGDGIKDPDEECDLGAPADGGQNNNQGACTLSCNLAECGDNFVRTGVEECDGSPVVISGVTYQCTTPTSATQGCRFRRCGNGIINPNTTTPALNETCDNDVVAVGATPAVNDGCSATCKVEFCGDGIRNQEDGLVGSNPKEACDSSGVDAATCNRDCTTPRCGDGILNVLSRPTGSPVGAVEQCDDGANANNDGCNSLCQLESCGDGILQSSEQCDGALGLLPCNTTTCRQMICGNGFVDNVMGATEQCDLGAGNNVNTASCKANCRLNTCGDSFQGPGEQCDNGGSNTDSGALGSCTTTCDFQYCGDGLTGTGEQCDNGVNNGNNKDCTLQCKLSVCGDGYLDMDTVGDPVEACDNGIVNGANNLTVALPTSCPYDTTCTQCNAGCAGTTTLNPRCGDNVINGGEECDGTTIPFTCQDFGFGTGGSISCNASCAIVTTACDDCGNGVVEDGELCDDGDEISETRVDCAGYNTTCNFCNETCSAALPFTRVCGDTVCDAEESASSCPGDCASSCGDGIRTGTEACDDGNTSCGTCNASCTGPSTLAKATGLLVAVEGAALVDGATFTIGDGTTSVTFEFDNNSTVVSGNEPITYVGAETVSVIATQISAKIDGAGLTIDATAAGGAPVSLQNTRVGVTGNVGITKSVTAPDAFVVFGMSGGQGTFCAAAQDCVFAADCGSGVCTGASPVGECGL